MATVSDMIGARVASVFLRGEAMAGVCWRRLTAAVCDEAAVADSPPVDVCFLCFHQLDVLSRLEAVAAQRAQQQQQHDERQKEGDEPHLDDCGVSVAPTASTEEWTESSDDDSSGSDGTFHSCCSECCGPTCGGVSGQHPAAASTWACELCRQVPVQESGRLVVTQPGSARAGAFNRAGPKTRGSVGSRAAGGGAGGDAAAAAPPPPSSFASAALVAASAPLPPSAGMAPSWTRRTGGGLAWNVAVGEPIAAVARAHARPRHTEAASGKMPPVARSAPLRRRVLVPSASSPVRFGNGVLQSDGAVCQHCLLHHGVRHPRRDHRNRRRSEAHGSA